MWRRFTALLALFLALFLALAAAVTPALAQQDVKIGIGFGFAFLPLYVCDELKLVDKQSKAAHLDLHAKFQRFADSGELYAAASNGDVDMGPFGTAPLLAQWQQAKDPRHQIVAVSGISSLPLVLLTNRTDARSIGDLTSADRIAVPTPTSPQMYLLQMQSEKTFGTSDHWRNQIIVMPHAQAIAALVDETGQATAYFSSPPFTQLALRAANVHAILSSAEVMNGKSSFLILGAPRAYVDAEPQVAEIVEKAIDEAARFIHDDPQRAAQIYLTHEPSATLGGATMEAVVREVKDEFGSPVYGVQAMADFMVRLGELKTPLHSWKEIAAPPLLNSPST